MGIFSCPVGRDILSQKVPWWLLMVLQRTGGVALVRGQGLGCRFAAWCWRELGLALPERSFSQ